MYVYIYIYSVCVYDMCIYICCMYMLGSIAYNEDIVNNDHQQTNVVLLGKMKSELHHSVCHGGVSSRPGLIIGRYSLSSLSSTYWLVVECREPSINQPTSGNRHL